MVTALNSYSVWTKTISCSELQIKLNNALLRTLIQKDLCLEKHLIVLELLLKEGASLASRDDQDNTPLHLAIGCPSSLQLLLSYGASTEVRNFYDNTPLEEAIWQKSLPSVELLVKRESLLVKNPSTGNYPFQLALKMEELPLMELLYKALNSSEYFPPGTYDLHENFLKQSIFESGFEETREYFQNYLSEQLYTGILKGKIVMVRYALRNGADPEEPYYPLYHACSLGRIKAVKELLMRVVKIDKIHPTHGDTPFHQACIQGHFEIMALLMNHGADLSELSKLEQEALKIHNASLKTKS